MIVILKYIKTSILKTSSSNIKTSINPSYTFKSRINILLKIIGSNSRSTSNIVLSMEDRDVNTIIKLWFVWAITY